ncbi:MAG: hypothetical protein ACKVS5_13745 [Parvularculaceae bacterium]
MKRSLLLAALGLAALVSGAANAQANDPYRLMMSADANKDGKVSRDELIASRGSMFARLDRNGDGVLNSADQRKSRPRLAQVETARMDQLKADFDANGDGAIAKDEFVTGPTPLFDAADANGDNFVDETEAKAAKAAAAART